MYKNVLLSLLLGLLLGCHAPTSRGDATPPSEETSSVEVFSPTPSPAPREIFRPTLPPPHLEGEAQRQYLRDHFWDSFPFADSTYLSRIDSLAFNEAFAFYVARILRPDECAAMEQLMQCAAQQASTLKRFYQLSELWLHDPNSPYRNDELYIPVLRTMLASPYLSEWERPALSHDLRIALQNRVGEPANDFTYTLRSGHTGRLYALRADHTLLFISNPGCPMCREVQQAITASPMLSQRIEQGRLQVLMLYPDAELEEWYAHYEEVPARWINAYDQGCRIRENLLYDLRAIPALYLLDAQKRVLLKDVVDVALVEYVIDHQ